MDDDLSKYRLWLGLVAFCIGLVILFNLSNLLGNSYNPTGGALALKIFIEIIVAVLIFGGLILMIIAIRSDKTKPSK